MATVNLDDMTKRDMAKFAAKEKLAEYGLTVPKTATKAETIALVKTALARKAKALAAEAAEEAEPEEEFAEDEDEFVEEEEDDEFVEEEEEEDEDELAGFETVHCEQDRTGERRPKGPGFSISRQTLSINVPAFRLFSNLKKAKKVNILYNEVEEQILIQPGGKIPLRIRHMQRKGEEKKIVSYYLNIADLLKSKGYGDKYKKKGDAFKHAHGVLIDVPLPIE